MSDSSLLETPMTPQQWIDANPLLDFYELADLPACPYTVDELEEALQEMHAAEDA